MTGTVRARSAAASPAPHDIARRARRAPSIGPCPSIDGQRRQLGVELYAQQAELDLAGAPSLHRVLAGACHDTTLGEVTFHDYVQGE